MNIKYRFTTIIRDVAFRTGVDYVIVKRILLSYLRWMYFRIRTFNFVVNHYFRYIPDMENESRFSEVEAKKAYRWKRRESIRRRKIAKRTKENLSKK